MERLLFRHCARVSVGDRLPKKGFGDIKANIAKYNKASEHFPFFVLTDLDNRECAPALLRDWLPEKKSNGLLFRVAVREVESWLLADREGFSSFLGISKTIMPLDPDGLHDPKETLFSLVRRSRKRVLRDALLPTQFSKYGPDYNRTLGKFINATWTPESAAETNPSLRKAINALEAFVKSRC